MLPIKVLVSCTSTRSVPVGVCCSQLPDNCDMNEAFVAWIDLLRKAKDTKKTPMELYRGLGFNSVEKLIGTKSLRKIRCSWLLEVKV